MRFKFYSLLGLLFTFHSQAASVDYRIHWRSLRTPHFEIIYDRDQRDLADAYAVAAEQAYEILRTRFSEQPDKTTIVLADLTDEANGSATFLPYATIQIFPVLPDSLGTLDYYGNWPLEMVLHEYTHINAFTPIHGVAKPLHWIFGSVLHPTGILPRWWHEGLAVESETRFTQWGRLRSPRQSAELRAMILDGKLKDETIDRINETILPDFPYGDRPYLFGSILWEHMIQKAGGEKNVPEYLAQRYSSRVPFFINGPPEDLLGLDYQHLLGETYDDVDIKTQNQVTLIEAKHKETFDRFTDLDMEQFQPAISPDGAHLIFISDSIRRGQIRMIDRDGNQSFHELKSRKLVDALSSKRLSWLPDSQSFIYDAIDEMDPYHSYRELYEYELKSGESTQLTFDLRAQEPAVSLDGEKIAFVGNRGGKQWLGLLDRASGTAKTLFHPGLSIRLGHPEFISDHQIAFTGRNIQGQEHLYVYDLKTGKIKTEINTKTELRRPTRTALGLLVADTSTGVENIGVADLNSQSIKFITNTTTEIQSADYDVRTKELIATRYTSEGRKLVAMKPVEGVEPPQLDSTINAKWPETPTPAKIDKSTFEDKSYQPWEYLWPRYWIPFLYPVYNGVFMQASTSISDPTNTNHYDASVAYDTVTGRPGYSLNFTNSSLPPDINLGYTRSEQYLSASGYVFDDQNATGSLAFYLPWLNPHWKMSAGYTYDHVDSAIASDQLYRQGPIATLSFNDWLDPRNEGAGTSLVLQHTQYLPGANNQFAYGRSFASLTQAWKKWLPPTNRIVLTLRGEVSPDLPFTDIGNFLSLADSSLGANYLVPLTNSPFLFRGYPNGTFVGRKVLNWNAEYQLSLSRKASGWGTLPIFSRGWDLAVTFDGIAVDGLSFNGSDLLWHYRDMSQIALSAGLEARWNSSLFYSMPVTWIFGLYNGFDQKSGTGLFPFFGLALSDISSIDRLRKTP
jgi:hypothetical protein